MKRLITKNFKVYIMSLRLPRPLLNQLFKVAQSSQCQFGMISASKETSHRIHHLNLESEVVDSKQIDFLLCAQLIPTISPAEKIIAIFGVQTTPQQWNWCNVPEDCWCGEIFVGMKGVLEIITFQIIKNKKIFFTLELTD